MVNFSKVTLLRIEDFVEKNKFTWSIQRAATRTSYVFSQISVVENKFETQTKSISKDYILKLKIRMPLRDSFKYV